MTVRLLSVKQQLESQINRRILLIEDNDVNRMLLSDYLSYVGYTVQGLSNARTLFSTIDKFQPDLILLDLKLPDIDGFLLIEQIKQKPDLCHIPIIVVSAFAFKADKERAMNLGANHYFVKPVNLTELSLTIAAELVPML
jgi:two-component system, cell cycle response regulator DivK